MMDGKTNHLLSKSPLNNILVLLKSKYFLIVVNADNFPFALRQTLFKCSSNFKSLSIVIPNNLTVLVSQFYHYQFYPINAQICD